MDYQNLTAAMLMDEPKRSEPFYQGVAAILRNRVEQVPVTSPYAQGTVENDAFFAGRMRGHNEFRNLLIEMDSRRDAVIERLRNLACIERSAA